MDRSVKSSIASARYNRGNRRCISDRQATAAAGPGWAVPGGGGAPGAGLRLGLAAAPGGARRRLLPQAARQPLSSIPPSLLPCLPPRLHPSFLPALRTAARRSWAAWDRAAGSPHARPLLLGMRLPQGTARRRRVSVGARGGAAYSRRRPRGGAPLAPGKGAARSGRQ